MPNTCDKNKDKCAGQHTCAKQGVCTATSKGVCGGEKKK